MLTIHRPNSPTPKSQCIPNLLPCRIHETGPVDASPRHWSPKPAEEDGGDLEAYFRGRKLKGKEIRVPKGYRGVVVREGLGQTVPGEKAATDKYTEVDEDVENEEADEEVKVLDEVATFDEVVVWGHEQIVDSNDGFVRGMAEWIPFAEAMHAVKNTDSRGNGDGGGDGDLKK